MPSPNPVFSKFRIRPLLVHFAFFSLLFFFCLSRAAGLICVAETVIYKRQKVGNLLNSPTGLIA